MNAVYTVSHPRPWLPEGEGVAIDGQVCEGNPVYIIRALLEMQGWADEHINDSSFHDTARCFTAGKHRRPTDETLFGQTIALLRTFGLELQIINGVVQLYRS